MKWNWKRFGLSFGTLLLTAVLACLVWRWELYGEGWEGLGWVMYSHAAVPIGLALFLTWLFFQWKRLELWQRAALTLGAGAYGYMVLWFFEQSLRVSFIGGPSAMVLHMSVPSWKLELYRVGMEWGPVLIPLLPALTLRLQKTGVPWSGVVAAGVMGALAWPLSIYALELVDHRGGADAIHAIKSGFMIIPMVLACGLPFVFWQGTGGRAGADTSKINP